MVSPSSEIATNLPRCVSCALPVFELDGQFTVLDSYLLDEASRDLASTAGTWHLTCLDATPATASWGRLRAANLRLRGYKDVAVAGEWTVLELARTRDRIAVSGHGAAQSLAFSDGSRRRVPGGVSCHGDVSEYGLQLDAARMARLQEALRSSGSYPLLSLADTLGMRERLSHPELLARAAFHFEPELEEEWTPTFVLARCAYDVFVPEELSGYLL